MERSFFMSNILELFNKYSSDKLVGYFLVLWGAGYLVGALSTLYYAVSYLGLHTIISILHLVVDVPAGLILVTLGLRILNQSS